MKKKLEYTDTKDFFDSLEVSSEEYNSRRLGFSRILGQLIGFVLCAVVIGGLVSVYPLMALSGAAKGAEPVVHMWKELPTELPEVAIAQRNFMYDKNGDIIAQLWSEDRVELKSLDQISDFAINGLIDTEDKRFYENKGFDPIGTTRALASGSGGGSGITQQLIKNLQFYNLLGKDKKDKAVERSVIRKAKELKLALEYEKTHSKEEILLTYFNTVAFGGPNVYGIQTSSKYFFGKDAKDLTLGEAAALVGSANNPIVYNMDEKGNKEWKKRQKIVIDRLLAEGHITKKQASDAKKEKLNLIRKSSGIGTCASSKFPFYCEYVLEHISENPRYGETKEERAALIARGGLQIRTNLDPKIMKTIDKYLESNWGNQNRIIAPTVVVEPGTGAVLGFGANRNYGNGKGKTEINLADVPAAEGSAYKIFTLAAALNNGYTEDSLKFSSYSCPLAPQGYDYPGTGFKNSNSCAFQGGLLNYKQATAYSSNTWYVTLSMKIGVNSIKDFSKSVGLKAPDSITERSLAYTLGPVENSPINVAAAFATFSNKGVYCPPTPISNVTYRDGTNIAMPDSYDPKKDACRAVISPKNAGIVLKAMRANVSGEIPNAFGRKANVPGHDTGGKSGTNEGLNSIWAQVSSRYSVYTNVYDMDRPTRGIEGAVFRGVYRPWSFNTAEATGSDIMKILLKDQPNRKLDFNNPETNLIETEVNESDFFVIPSVIGITPSEALDIMNNVGITSYVSKTEKASPAGFPKGLIVEQSIKPGTRMSKGTKKEVVLYIGK